MSHDEGQTAGSDADASLADSLSATSSSSMSTEASFLQFLSGMAAQTLMHLGKMTNPMTNQMTIDLPNAKYSIDLLGVLEEKTKGNLSGEEENYLRTALTDLRMQYLKATDGSHAADSGVEA